MRLQVAEGDGRESGLVELLALVLEAETFGTSDGTDVGLVGWIDGLAGN